MSKERLTIYGGNGEHYESINPIDTPYEYGKINLQRLIDKLAEYEDLEDILRDKLTEEAVNVITASKKDFSEWLDRILWINKKCDELAREVEQYRNLEEQGLLLRLPCKVGDTVWGIVDECEGDNAGCYGTCDTCHNRRLGIIENQFTIDMIDEFGNWFFLTQSEAEEKLRELEGTK